MASEIRVNKIENRSGLGTVTFADTGVDLAGIVTATTFSGSGASLTALPAAQLTGALPAISGASLTGMASTDNVRTGILDVAGISTFRNTMNVGAAVTISESGIEASGIGITCANLNGGQIAGRRNIIINGAMQVAQRATSNTSGGDGYYSVDRIRYYNQGIDNDLTKAQIDVNSNDAGDNPYNSGIRKAFKITNGNQSGGADVADIVEFMYRVEAQDIAHSGWEYINPNSFITLSFWCKSSVAQNFNFFVKAQDGTAQSFPFETGSLTANTWTRVIKTIPGNSNLTFQTDEGEGLRIDFPLFYGTNYTGSTNLNQWNTFSGSTRTPDHTSTWYTTDGATFEFTGLQLEAGSQATAFEHRSFGEEMNLCRRYFYMLSSGEQTAPLSGFAYAASNAHVVVNFPVEMRTIPSYYGVNGTSYFSHIRYGAVDYIDTLALNVASSKNHMELMASGNMSNGGYSGIIRVENTAARIGFDAEI